MAANDAANCSQNPARVLKRNCVIASAESPRFVSSVYLNDPFRKNFSSATARSYGECASLVISRARAVTRGGKLLGSSRSSRHLARVGGRRRLQLRLRRVGDLRVDVVDKVLQAALRVDEQRERVGHDTRRGEVDANRAVRGRQPVRVEVGDPELLVQRCGLRELGGCRELRRRLLGCFVDTPRVVVR